MTYLFVDLDHTVTAAWRRDHLIPENHYWSDEVSDRYHLDSVNDEPIEEMVYLVKTMVNHGWMPYGLTARPVKYLPQTRHWLDKHKLLMFDILMRANTDRRPAHIVKESLVRPFLDKGEPIIVLDDRVDVCSTLSKLPHVTVMNVMAARR